MRTEALDRWAGGGGTRQGATSVSLAVAPLTSGCHVPDGSTDSDPRASRRIAPG